MSKPVRVIGMHQSTPATARERLQVGSYRLEYGFRWRYGKTSPWQVLTCPAWLETNDATLVLVLVLSLILNPGS